MKIVGAVEDECGAEYAGLCVRAGGGGKGRKLPCAE